MNDEWPHTFGDNNVWDVEAIRRLQAHDKGLIVQWLIDSTIEYLRHVETDWHEQAISFVWVAKVMRSPERLLDLSNVLHMLRPFMDEGIESIVSNLILARKALIDNEDSDYNLRVINALTRLSERPAFHPKGLSLLRQCFLQHCHTLEMDAKQTMDALRFAHTCKIEVPLSILLFGNATMQH